MINDRSKIEIQETEEILVYILDYVQKHKMGQEHLMLTYQILLNGTFYDLGYTDGQAKRIYKIFLDSYKNYKNIKKRTLEEVAKRKQELGF